MLKHCITFFKEEPDNPGEGTAMFHCDVTADNELIAVEVALRETVRNNISLAGATGLEVRMVMDLPPGLVETIEVLRTVQHGGKPAATPQAPASSHLH